MKALLAYSAILFAAGLLCFLVSQGGATRATDMLAYPGWALMCAGAVLYMQVQRIKGVPFVIAGAAAIVLLTAIVDQCRVDWKENGIEYSVHRQTLTGTPLEMTIVSRTSSGDTIRTYGPLCATGKRHGYWLTTINLAPSDAQWYWYGEPVSEGEWHLRN